MAAQQWYYRKKNKRFGPVSSAELKQLAASGELESTDFLRGVGMSEWVPASKIKGLFTPPKAEEELGLASAIQQPMAEAPKPEPLAPRPASIPAPPVLPRPVPPPVPNPPPAPQSFAAVPDPSNPFAQFGLEQGQTPIAATDPFAGAPTFNFPANVPFDNLAAMGSQGQALPQTQRPMASSGTYAPSAHGGSRLQNVAWRQRALVYSYLIIYFLAFFAIIALKSVASYAMALEAEGTMTQEEISIVLASSGSIKVYIFFLACTFLATFVSSIWAGMLAKSLRYGMIASIGMGIAFWSFGLILLFVLNMQANEQLRQAGYQIGFLGVNPNHVR